MNKADLSNLMAHGKLKNYGLVCYLYYYNNRPNPKITCYDATTLSIRSQVERTLLFSLTRPVVAIRTMTSNIS